MNGGDDKKHLDTLGVLLDDFFYDVLGDMDLEDRWREHLTEQGKRSFPWFLDVFSSFFESR